MKPAAILTTLVLCACASGAPAPVTYGAGRESPRQAERAPQTGAPPQPPARAPAAEPDWAASEGTPLSEYALRPEDVQPYDPASPPRAHRVAAGELLYDIATRYQVPLRALIDQNGLEAPYALREGQNLRLPPPRVHTVARGESFEEVARRYSIDARSLALLNRMQPPYNVRAGDHIVLPAIARAALNEEAPVLEPAPSGSVRFAWPISGEISARFGAQPGGRRLDGIEITGTVGASVKAAADGEVVFAGDNLPGYDFLVLIAHADNYVTAYAYNRRALVREGQHVRAGETIAELGQRPGQSARLLFQVRQGGAPVDPAPLLGAR